VRHAIRAAREAMGLTQTQVATAMEWSLSKVMRIENGDVNVAPNDLKPLLDFLEVRERDAVDRLVESARLSRHERWSVDPMVKRYHTPSMIELHQFEDAATTSRWYQNMFLPGAIQTLDYARALLAPSRYEVDAELLPTRVRMRVQRSADLIARDDGPIYMILMDESTLLRPVGGDRVMAEQLQYVVTIMEAARHHVRILPLTNQDFFLYGPFVMCDLDEFESAILYVENGISDQVIHSAELVRQHRLVFDHMWELSLDEKASMRRTKAAVTEYRGRS
jgi:transcriptional regulator with XRE-family HTH domain